MLIRNPPPLFPRKRKPRVRTKPAAPVATGPVLVAATYDAETPSLTLTFDRQVELSGGGGTLNTETITVHDGVGEVELLNSPDATGAGTMTLVVTLFPNGPWAGSGVTMTCGAGTGVVDEDGVPWAGVAGLSLPYP